MGDKSNIDENSHRDIENSQKFARREKIVVLEDEIPVAKKTVVKDIQFQVVEPQTQPSATMPTEEKNIAPDTPKEKTHVEAQSNMPPKEKVVVPNTPQENKQPDVTKKRPPTTTKGWFVNQVPMDTLDADE